MTNIELRRKALQLRLQGKSYHEIKQELHVSKSTLSYWLKGDKLTSEQLAALRSNNHLRIEKYRETMFQKRTKRLHQKYQDAKKSLLPLTDKELFIAGIFLYWGEGNKASSSTISINNTDPDVVKFTLHWFTQSLGIEKEIIKPFLHLYSDMNVENELQFWSTKLGIPMLQFEKVYIKKSRLSEIDHKGFGHGTCGLKVNNTAIKEKIMMSIRSIADNHAQKV